MREIKFRIWDKHTSEMIYTTTRDSYDWIPVAQDNPNLYELMQYTGLKDKNGVEIYEGDIVRLYSDDYCGLGKCESIAKITYSDCEFIADSISEGEVKDENSTTYEMQFYGYEGKEFRWEDLEVIGNIYQNKDLLK